MHGVEVCLIHSRQDLVAFLMAIPGEPNYSGFPKVS